MRTEMKCLDCDHTFEEVDALNASLDPYEYNPACPNCHNDNIELLPE